MTWEDAIESYKTYLILEKSLSSNSVEEIGRAHV